MNPSTINKVSLMSIIINLLKSKRKLLFVSLLWILVWVIPWGKLPTAHGNLYLVFLTDMIRLGIAIGIFIVPGTSLYVLLRRYSDPFHDWAGIVPVGFTLSVFLIAVIGLIGRIAGFSFGLVRSMFALVGMLELILVTIFKPDLIVPKDWLRQSFRSVGQNPPLLFALVIATLMTLHNDLLFIDDTSYLAYLTNWQYSSRLGFMNIVHDANVIENIRYWLALYPMGQALLSDLSGVPGVLLFGNYLELFLVPLAVVTSYWFARVLGLSKKAAGFSALIQVSLYTWMLGDELPAGLWFYQNMAEDKVSAAFILAPVFFAMVLYFVQKPTRNNRLLVIFSGFSMTLTHPVILFFSCAIAASVALFAWIARKLGVRQAMEILIICVGLMIPYAIIRLSDRTGEIAGPYDGEQASTTFEIDRYTNIINNVFYGSNPEVLMFLDIPIESNLYQAYQFFRIIPMILVALGGFIALKRVKQGSLYWYVLSSSLLVFFALLPYTGWILGYFVSARLLSRISWFSPVGLAGVLILKSIIDWFETSVATDRRRPTIAERRGVLWGLIFSFVFVSPFLIFSVSQRLPLYFGRLEQNKQLAEIGAFIDRTTSAPIIVIALDYRNVQLLPAVSAHANLISFREELEYNGHNNFLPLDEIRERIYASNAIRSLDRTVSPEEKCSLIREYDVRFILAQAKDVGLFESTLTPCSSTIQAVYRTKELVLLEIR